MAVEAEEGGKRGEGEALMAVTKGRKQRERGAMVTVQDGRHRREVKAVAAPKGRKRMRQGMGAAASTWPMCWAARSTCVGAGQRARGCLWPFRSAGGCPSSWCRPREGSELLLIIRRGGVR